MIDKPYFDIFTLGIIGIVALCLGIYFLTKYQRSPAIIAFAMACISIGGWVLTNGPTLALDTAGKAYDLLTRLAWVFASLIFIFLYLFMIWYPLPSEKISSRFLTALFLPFVLISLLVYGSDNIIEGFNPSKYGSTIYGPDYWIISIYLFILFALIIFESIRKLKVLDGIHLLVMRFVFWGTLISGVIGLVNNIVLPYYFKIETVSWLAPFMSMVWLGCVGWVLMRK